MLVFIVKLQKAVKLVAKIMQLHSTENNDRYSLSTGLPRFI
jgi:hypothetical protein